VGKLSLSILIQILFAFNFLFAQDASTKIITKIDTTTIKVGEQVNLEIKIESTDLSNIVFPEEFNFSPVVIAEQFPLDTIAFQRNKSISKKFKLTLFDEGSYFIKPQGIRVGSKIFYSDSIPLDVLTVKVDTVSKKFFNIKEINQTKEQKKPISKYLYALLCIILSCIIIYYLHKRLIATDVVIEEYKTPFEIAVNSLKSLDEQNISNQLDVKQYYTQMTDIIKLYFEKDIEISAFESTTNQLIDKLSLLKKSKKLKISQETINNFTSVLSNADLAKFAKYNPDKKLIIDDKKLLESVLVETKKAIPNDIEKELEERKQRERKIEFIKNSRRKKFYIISSLIAISSLFISTFIIIPEKISSIFIFNKNKKILKSDWVNSTYTQFNLSLESPDALIRSKDSLNYSLNYFSENNDLVLELSVDNFDENSDLVNIMLDEFRVLGYSNIITKEEEFSTFSDKKGVKVFGSFNSNDSGYRFNYSTIFFATEKNTITIQFIFEEGDENLDEIVRRIENSIDFVNG